MKGKTILNSSVFHKMRLGTVLLLFALLPIVTMAQTNIAPSGTPVNIGGGGSTPYGPDNYNDGIIPTIASGTYGWVSSNGSIEFTWSAPYEISSVKWYFADRPMNSTIIQYWNGSSYQTIQTYTRPSGSTDNDQVTFATSVITTKLKFSGITPSSVSPNFREIEIYGVLAQVINAPSFPGTICAGATQSVNYSTVGSFNAGTTFSVELSNAAGSFSSPTTIGSTTLASAATSPSGTISTTIPSSATAGTGYRIRLKSSTPALTSADNGSNITVSVAPTISVASSTNPTTCVSTDGSITLSGLTASQQYTVNYKKGGVSASPLTLTASATGTVTISNLSGGTYTNINAKNSSGCTSADVGPATLTTPAPPAAPSITSNAPVCPGANLNLSTTATGVSYTWSGPNSYSATTQSVTIPVTTTTDGLYTLTVKDLVTQCTAQSSMTITNHPVVTVNTVSDKNACHNGTVAAINFSGSVSGTTFSWTNNETSIGLAASGTGNIPSFTATNTSNIPVVATITVTPMANGCTGNSMTFSITINPIPNINTITNQAVCNNAPTSFVNFNGSVVGTVNNWTNSNTAIGLAANGTGNIPVFTANNTTNAPISATITVTPSINGCTGTPGTFTYTVNPTPTVSAVSNQTICDNAASTAVTFTGSVSGTTYSWTNNRAAIGLAATGTGDIASFTAANTTGLPITATINVTPVANGCSGNTGTFTIKVNPRPTVNAVTNQTICNSSMTAAVNFSGAVSGTSYSWTNDNASIGLAASGSNNVLAFSAMNGGSTNAVANITVTPSANGCTGTPGTYSYTVKPTPVVTAVSNQNVCNNANSTAVNFTSAVSGATYTWTNNRTSIGLAASGSGNVSSFTAVNATNLPVVATINVTPMASGCTGPVATYTYTVNPTPTVNAVASQTLCNAATTTTVSFNGAVSGATYSWTNNNTSIGLAGSGNNNILSFNAINTGNTNAVGTITVTPSANGCTGTAGTYTYTVKPTPTVTTVSSQAICNNANSTAVNFTGAVSGTTYSWINNRTSIGLAANGTGNIGTFMATNVTNTPVTATISVTPSANGCTGSTSTFTMTVNPTPAVNAVANQTLCNTAATTLVNFNGFVPGSTYSWINNNTSIGLAASGNGNIGSFTATNTTNVPAIGTITVTPSANGCTGASGTFTYTVNLTPTVATVSNQTICNNAGSTAVNFTGSVSGTTYTWINNNTSIGLAANGSGNIASFTAVNSTNLSVTSTIAVTPSANGCTGTSGTFMMTVNPTPSVNAVANQAVCNGATTNSVNFTGPVSGTNFSWTNSDPTIGIAAAGTNNIPTFVAINNTGVNSVGTITVTPSANGCVGISRTYTYIVYPTPSVSAIADQTNCNNAATTAVSFSGNVAGATYYWTNNNTAIGLGASGIGSIGSYTATNTSTIPIMGEINITPVANGCTGSMGTYTYTVNPTPTVMDVPDQVVCNGAPTTAVSFTGAVSNTAYAWINDNTSVGLAASGNTNVPIFTAANVTTDPVMATVTVTPTANSCVGAAESYTYTVNPTPMLTSVLNAPAICDNTTFSYTPASATNGTSFAWSRKVVPGITNVAANGIGNPNEVLHNNSTNPVSLNYRYTLTAKGCMNAQNVSVTVNPTPRMKGTLTGYEVCGSSEFNYTPASATSGTAFTWKRNNVTGITPATGTGSGSIKETLTNSTKQAQEVTYIYTLTANNCSNTEQVKLQVDPLPDVPNITTMSPAAVCSGTMYQNFGASVPPASGVTYSWTSMNADVWAQGQTDQYAVVSFPNPGASEVIVTAKITATSCTTKTVYNVSVSTSKANNPELVYYNGRFICQLGNATYRWGYDDKMTLDSAIIPNEVNQSYNVVNPDFNNKYYWVMTEKDGCTQKTYYNRPLTIIDNSELTEMKAYPNPASDRISIAFNYKDGQKYQMVMQDMSGRTIKTIPVNGKVTTIDVAELPAGFYMISCYNDGVKLVSSRFIKN